MCAYSDWQVLPDARNLAHLAADARKYFTEEACESGDIIIKVTSTETAVVFASAYTAMRRDHAAHEISFVSQRQASCLVIYERMEAGAAFAAFAPTTCLYCGIGVPAPNTADSRCAFSHLSLPACCRLGIRPARWSTWLRAARAWTPRSSGRTCSAPSSSPSSCSRWAWSGAPCPHCTCVSDPAWNSDALLGHVTANSPSSCSQ